MKTILSLLVLLSLTLTVTADRRAILIARNNATTSGGGGCTLHQGTITNESFEGSDSLTWTDTGTVDRSAALSGTSPCSGLGSQCLEVNWDGMATQPYSTWNRGSTLNSTLYWRFYFNVVSHSTISTDNYSIFTPGESSTPLTFAQFRVSINNTSGQLGIQAISSGSSSTLINISAATWYRVEIKYVNNSVGGSEFKLFDSSGSQVGSTQNWDTGNNFLQYIHAGIPFADDTKAFRVQIDGIGVDDTGYLGQ